MQGGDKAKSVEAIRRFSRFYTRKLGLLEESYLARTYSLTEGRLIYEIAQCDSTNASALAQTLGLDPGYLSRLIKGLEERGLLGRKPNQRDARQMDVSLTEAGIKEFAEIDALSRQAIGAMLDALPAPQRVELVDAVERVERLLSPQTPRNVTFMLRPHQPGDIGWVIERHGALYAGEFGFDNTFEALVAEIAAEFLRKFDARREQCWIAEMDGERVGSVFIVRKNDDVARLRLLLLEPAARGFGLGQRLVDECIRFARTKGYRRIVLWTNANLLAARAIYEKAGFRLVREEPHHSFGVDLIGQDWELVL